MDEKRFRLVVAPNAATFEEQLNKQDLNDYKPLGSIFAIPRTDQAPTAYNLCLVFEAKNWPPKEKAVTK